VIEIHDQIEPPVPVLDRMTVEIHVRIQIMALAVLVRTAAEVPRVVQQLGYRRDAADQIEQLARPDQFVEGSVARADSADPLDRGLAAELTVLIARVAALERRKFVEQPRRILCREEIIDDDMAERLASYKAPAYSGARARTFPEIRESFSVMVARRGGRG